MSDGARTRDIRDHNATLYQLSYTHHGCGLPQGRQRRLLYLLADRSRESAQAEGFTVVAAPAYFWAMSAACRLSGPGGATNTASR